MNKIRYKDTIMAQRSQYKPIISLAATKGPISSSWRRAVLPSQKRIAARRVRKYFREGPQLIYVILGCFFFKCDRQHKSKLDLLADKGRSNAMKKKEQMLVCY